MLLLAVSPILHIPFSHGTLPRISLFGLPVLGVPCRVSCSSSSFSPSQLMLFFFPQDHSGLLAHFFIFFSFEAPFPFLLGASSACSLFLAPAVGPWFSALFFFPPFHSHLPSRADERPSSPLSLGRCSRSNAFILLCDSRSDFFFSDYFSLS